MIPSIRIGTMVKADRPGFVERVGKLAEVGFESIQPMFWANTSSIDLAELATRTKEAIGNHDVTVEALGLYGNPLMDEACRASWEAAIEAAPAFGASSVAGFTGRIKDEPIEASLPRFREVWGELARRAEDKGVKIAFENCAMDGNWQSGDWNIAHTPVHWEMMFDAVPSDALGLEWEPCHQLVALIDPMPQIRKWSGKIFHVHGKDASVRREVIAEHGIIGNVPFAYMRTPGFGDSNWSDIISELRLGGYAGAIDIEGWHDPVYRQELEMTGQIHALEHLKRCRGGALITHVDNPG